VKRPFVALIAALVVLVATLRAVDPLHYQFSFPQPTERWLQVEATFTALENTPLELRMSRSSPGRYAAHDFARNVFELEAFGDEDRALKVDRTGPAVWAVRSHGPDVRVRYKVRGDRLDGTYLAIDSTHAHVNMPAVVLWASGYDDRPITVSFDLPTSAGWKIATQLYPGSTDTEFTAPNLQYLIDSPVELGPLSIETFRVGSQTFRFAAHHTGTEVDLERLVGDVAKIVAEEEKVYGEFPQFETGTYTFLADYLPSAVSDGMEHRNSTVMTWPGTIAAARAELLDAVSHEFFHVWNVERIRPRSLEPFDLTKPNRADELWLAEGFTQYYGPLALRRAGLIDVEALAQTMTMVLNAMDAGAGRLPRSAEELSRMAVDEDAEGRSAPGVMSYYYVGAAIALALDLSLRERSEGRLSLDDFMKAMWREFGKPGGSRAGYVDRPYTIAEAEAVLAQVAGDRAFARRFFVRYIHGREIADYGRLLEPAGFLVRRLARGQLEVVTLESTGAALSSRQRAFREAWLEAR
jgi:predicted metalloprotease with PDZ domain